MGTPVNEELSLELWLRVHTVFCRIIIGLQSSKKAYDYSRKDFLIKMSPVESTITLYTNEQELKFKKLKIKWASSVCIKDLNAKKCNYKN